MPEVTLLAMEETLAIGDQVLKVAELGPIHRWIIDFGDDAIPKRKPDLAGSSIRSSYAVFASCVTSEKYLEQTRPHRLHNFLPACPDIAVCDEWLENARKMVGSE
jgi:hypothetical protein